MGVLPLQFREGETRAVARAHRQGEPTRSSVLNGGAAKQVTVVATPASGGPIRFEVRVRIDTPKEREYFQHGGILQYVVRQLAGAREAA